MGEVINQEPTLSNPPVRRSIPPQQTVAPATAAPRGDSHPDLDLRVEDNSVGAGVPGSRLHFGQVQN